MAAWQEHKDNFRSPEQLHTAEHFRRFAVDSLHPNATFQV